MRYVSNSDKINMIYVAESMKGNTCNELRQDAAMCTVYMVFIRINAEMVLVIPAAVTS